MTDTRLDAAVTLPGEDFSRVALTPAAVQLLRKLWLQHGPLMFHQSGGCCDGSAPMCYPAGDFITGSSDVLLGLFDLSDGLQPLPLEFWMSREQFNYWSHTGPGERLFGGSAGGQTLPDPVHADGLARLASSTNTLSGLSNRRAPSALAEEYSASSPSHYSGRLGPSSGWTLSLIGLFPHKSGL